MCLLCGLILFSTAGEKSLKPVGRIVEDSQRGKVVLLVGTELSVRIDYQIVRIRTWSLCSIEENECPLSFTTTNKPQYSPNVSIYESTLLWFTDRIVFLTEEQVVLNVFAIIAFKNKMKVNNQKIMRYIFFF